MKIRKNISGNLIAKVSAVGLLCLLLTSCLKENTPPNINQPVALLSFAQGSPDEVPLDFYLNDNKVNGSAIYYGNYLNYVNAFAGSRNANFYAAGTMSILLSRTITLNPGAAYSLFLANVSSNPEILLLTDTLAKPAAGNAGLRFVDLSPDAPNVDLAIKGGAVLVHNIAARGFTTFLSVPVNAGYTFEVRKSGTTTVLATLTNVPLAAGSVYTAWFDGLAIPKNSTDKFSLSMITNAFFN